MYECNVTRYDLQSAQTGLFVHYIDNFFKMKTEDSRYPDWFRRTEDECHLVENFYASKGIRLNKDAIRTKVAESVPAKHCLNSMWGK